ncbi:hypothetical protein, partial [Nonomuraea insulae]
MVRLAFGVVTGRDEQVRDVHGRLVTDDPSSVGDVVVGGAAPGVPVAVGPGDADPGPAVAALARLVSGDSGDGVTAAGAGVELSPGFVSARLDGARGDRRDAVLAAAQVLGLDGLHRLGDRAGVLVALFGVEATRPVAAAASQAIADGRWAALQLASAASGVLGAEQLVHVLNLGASAPPTAVDPTRTAVVDPTRAAASTMAGHLAQVLGGFPRRRRLDLLLDLWERVAARQEEGRRAGRLRATQGRQSRLAELRTRYSAHEDDLLIRQIRSELGHEPSLGEAARWFPAQWQWTVFMSRTMADALAATVLLRTAVAVADHGAEEGVARCAAQLAAAAALIRPEEAGLAARRVPGLAGLPARPGCYVRDLAARRKGVPAQYVYQRLARAAEYAKVVMEAVTDRLGDADEQLRGWSPAAMREWRGTVGYTVQRDPAEWAQPPVGGERATLTERLAARPGVPAQEEETAGDLLWYAELADALAQLNGHERATVEYGVPCPYADWEPDPDEEGRLVPALDSIPSALAGAAHLVSFGGRAARGRRTWEELAASLVADLEVTQALTVSFPLPEPLAALDRTILPGTELRLECARDARMLAQWSSYMGNCIGSPYYVEAAEQGKCALVALRDGDGRIVVNIELARGARGWRMAEIRARFNAMPEPGLHRRVSDWVAALPVPVPAPAPAHERVPDAGPVPRRRANRTFREVSGPLAELTRDAMTSPDVVAALRTLEVLHDARSGTDAAARPEVVS